MTIKTRTVKRQDGSWEVIRVLSASDLTEWSDDDPLGYEKSIVWIEDIDTLRFVRSIDVRCARGRRGALSLSTGERVIGYAKLTPDAPRDPKTEFYTRRLFYLKPSDLEPGGSLPPDAIDPRTVLPGVRGAAPVVSVGPPGHNVHETFQPDI